MHIIAKRALRFKRKGKSDVLVAPSNIPQVVPGDVAEDPLFGHALRDGSIIAMEYAEAPAKEVTVELIPEVVEEEQAEEGNPKRKKK